MLKTLFRPTNTKRIAFFIFGDVCISLFTIYISFLLRFNFHIPDNYLPAMWKMATILLPAKVVFLLYFHLYFTIWKFFGFVEYKKLIYAHLVAYLLFAIVFLTFQSYFLPFPRSVIGIDLFLSFVLIGFFRGSKRFLNEKSQNYDKKAIIYGANEKASTLIKSAISSDIRYFIEAIIDKKYAGNYFSNIRVYHVDDFEKLVKRYRITAILLTETLQREELDRLIEKCDILGVKEIKKIQLLEENSAPTLENISVEDLLARRPKDLDKTLIQESIKDKIVLITGAGGSIGSELARQCLKFGAKKLLLIDHSEFNLYSIGEELNSDRVKLYMFSVLNKEMLEKTISTCRADIVIHAAAYKHVPLVEENVEEGIRNNIIGTKNVIDMSIKYGVKKCILISTDKAVRPTNVMGATKRVCELYAGNVDSKSTDIVAVRFGNVLGSSGSVIPKFKKQIEDGGPVTVTHPDIIRYFMLIPEACELVLQTGAIAKGGEIFILDMGKPIKIVDLAKKMVELSGRKDIDIEFTGLRPGEKLYEELLINDSDKKTKYSSIMIVKKTKYDIKKLNNDIQELLACENKIKKLQEIIPEFSHK